MPNTDESKGGRDQGNAIENETREADSRNADSRDGDAIEEIIRRNAKPEVTEDESKLAEEYRDGGAPVQKKY
jgi:hypothetical protein